MARRAVSENPYRERAWCALMLALYRLGRQSEALEVAHDLREMLADGLGLDPSPEARLLQEQILTQDPALDHQAHVRLNPAHPGLLEAVSEPEVSVAAGLVGRHDVSEALDRVAMDATSGHGRFVVVDGPAGMGKSAVLHELTARLQASGGLVLRGGGVSAGASPALWPWVSILRQLVAADPEVTEAARTGGSAAALALLDPSVATTPESEGIRTRARPGACSHAALPGGRRPARSGAPGHGRWLFSSTTPTGWTRTRWACWRWPPTSSCLREWSSRWPCVPTRYLRCRTRSMRWRRGTALTP